MDLWRSTPAFRAGRLGGPMRVDRAAGYRPLRRIAAARPVGAVARGVRGAV